MSLLRRTAAAALILATSVLPAAAAPALWEVSDADSSIWLFGSMHALPPDADWRTPAFDQTLNAAETIYFEADIGPLGQLGIMLKGIKMAFTAKADPWLGRLTPDETAKLGAAIAPLGLTPEQLGAYAPWLAEAMIEDRVMTGLGFRGDLGVDSTLQAELPKEKKAFFETAAGQMDMLAADSEAQQIARLLAAIGDVGNMPGELRAMATAWQNGDTDALAGAVDDDPTLDQAFAETMVFDRNRKWVTTIEALLAGNHRDLIVVGAGHLVGDGSVVDLLGKDGFTVRRIQ